MALALVEQLVRPADRLRVVLLLAVRVAELGRLAVGERCADDALAASQPPHLTLGP